MDLSLPGIDGWEATRQLKADPRPDTSPSSRSPATLGAGIARCARRRLRRVRAQAAAARRRRRGSERWRARARPVQPIGPDVIGIVIAVHVWRARRAGRRRRRRAGHADHDQVAVEEPMEVRVNGAPFAVIMRTPGRDRELAAGFLLAEDVIRGGAELGTIEHCQDATEEGRGNTLERHRGRRGHATAGEAAGRAAPGDDDGLVRAVRPAHDRVAARACGHGRWPWPVSADVVRELPLRCARRSACSRPPAVCTRPASSIARAPAAHRRRRRPPQRRRQDHRPPLLEAAAARPDDARRVGPDVVRAGAEGAPRRHPVLAAVSAPSSLAIELARAPASRSAASSAATLQVTRTPNGLPTESGDPVMRVMPWRFCLLTRHLRDRGGSGLPAPAPAGRLLRRQYSTRHLAALATRELATTPPWAARAVCDSV